MINRLLFSFLILFPAIATAQVIGPVNSTFNSIRQNGVSSIAATGDTVWISPSLNRNIGNSPDWFRPIGIDSIDANKGRVFSLAVRGDTVVAGLGYTAETLAGNQPAGYGYYLSTDGGNSWRFSDFLLDRFTEGDTTFTYGGQTYNRKRIIVPEQSPPYNIAFRGSVIFSANWASGLLRSTNFGNSWERVVLPPFGERLLTPERDDYFWFDCVETQNGRCTVSENIYNSVEDDNLKGFALHIDSQQRVWFGSAGGINISDNALTAPIDSIRWRNVGFENSINGLLARWVVEIQEDPESGRIWLTNWLAESSNSLFAGQDQFGVVFTDDGGQTFKQRLIGEKILGITFKDGYVFAAGENGLFISDDGGDRWIESPQIRSANAVLKSTVEFQSATATTNRVWIGTTDGIISTGDYGKSWEINRVNFPLSGGNTYATEAKTVNSYAYPNPFSPDQHEIVRIRFDVDQGTNVRIRIFDFAMKLVRELDDESNLSGSYEALWDGLDGNGLKVANGPYFYIIDTGSETINGKILLIE